MSYLPVFKGPLEGYIVNFINRHHWKVARTMPREDLKQEAYLIFLRVSGKYPDLDTPQHFMALFKTAWYHHFIDLANTDTQSRVLVPSTVRLSEDGDEVTTDVVGESDSDGYLAVLLKQAPQEVVMVLNLFLNAPQEMINVALGSWSGRDRRCKAGGSKKICQMLGLPADQDILKQVEEYFQTPP